MTQNIPCITMSRVGFILTFTDFSCRSSKETCPNFD